MTGLRTLAAAAAVAAAAAGPLAQTAAAQKHEWKLTSYVPHKSGVWNNYMQRYIDAVHLFTGGEVRIRGFGVGVLAGPFDAWDAVRKGTADICFCYAGFAVNSDPANGIFGGPVGGMPMEEFVHWYVAGGGAGLLSDFRGETQELAATPAGFGSTEIFLHSHRKIEKLDDLRGMKIRTAGPWAEILASLGASATVIPPADIYTALERRVIDGTEFVTPSTNIKLGFHKIAKYIVVPGLHSPAHANEAVFRLGDWKALPQRLRDQLRAAAIHSGVETAAHVGVQDLDAVEKLMQGRNEWSALDADAVAAIERLGREWSRRKAEEQSAKGNPWMARVSDSYWGFYTRWKKFGFYRHN